MKLKIIKKKLITLGDAFINANFEEIIIPSIWDTETFIEKAGGSEILNQMFAFKDKGNRNVCLVPEITGIIQELFRNNYFKTSSNPNYTKKLFYVSRCYRYEKPQIGRQREFTQLGVEIITTENDKTLFKNECIDILKNLLDSNNTNYNFVDSVKRGLTYYIEDGFEVECNNLGAQKQIAGGGTYKEGVGFAIGLERWLLALENKK
jgi:histidyl-tRNA synthetase